SVLKGCGVSCSVSNACTVGSQSVCNLTHLGGVGMRRLLFGSALLLLLSSASAFAQQTTGNITGRVLDQQGAAIPGVTVTAKNPSIGLTRTETSDAEGSYRISALPVGIYEVVAE